MSRIVVCIATELDNDITSTGITIGNLYTIEADSIPDKIYCMIINDDDMRLSYDTRFFISIEEHRQNTINNIISD